MAVTVEQKTKMYDTPENTSINEAHGIPSQNPDAPSEWGWQSFLTLINHLGVNFSQIKGVAQSATNPGASKVGDVWFWGDYGSYPYFGQPVTEFNQIGFFLKGASSWSKYTIKTLYSYSIKDGETGETIEKQLDDVTRYNSSTGNFELRGESIRDATITLNAFSQAVLDYIGSGGTITNNPDERHLDKFTDGVEKLRVKDGFEGKTYLYNPGQYATSADLKTAVEALVSGGNVHLVIDENIDGGGLTWTLPTGTIIDFARSGRITNVTLDGDYDIRKKTHYCIGTDVAFSGTPHASDGVDVSMFNADNTGATDSFAAFQACADLASLIGSNSGTKTKIYGNGTYKYSDSIFMKNVALIGDFKFVPASKAVKEALSIGNELNRNISRIMPNQASPMDAASVVNVIRDVVKGDKAVSVDDVTPYSVGDLIRIGSDEAIFDGTYYNGTSITARRGELRKIADIDATNNYITLDSSIIENRYLVADNAIVTKVNSVSFAIEGTVEIDMISVVDDPVDNYNSGIVLFGVDGCDLKNIKIKGSPVIGVAAYLCYNLSIDGGENANGIGYSRYTGTDSLWGYGIRTDACTNVTMRNILFKQNRHSWDADYGGVFATLAAYNTAKTWEVRFENCDLYGQSQFDSPDIHPHEGVGSVFFKDSRFHGVFFKRDSEIAQYAGTGVAGTIYESNSADIDNRFYLAKINSSGQALTDTTYFKPVVYSSLYHSVVWAAGSFDSGEYVIHNQEYWRANKTTTDTPSDASADWDREIYPYAGEGVGVRGEVRETVIESCHFYDYKTPILVRGTKKMVIKDITLHRCACAFRIYDGTDGNALIEDLTVDGITAYDSCIFANSTTLWNTSVQVSFTTLNIDNVKMIRSRYGFYSHTAFPLGIHTLSMNNWELRDCNPDGFASNYIAIHADGLKHINFNNWYADAPNMRLFYPLKWAGTETGMDTVSFNNVNIVKDSTEASVYAFGLAGFTIENLIAKGGSIIDKTGTNYNGLFYLVEATDVFIDGMNLSGVAYAFRQCTIENIVKGSNLFGNGFLYLENPSDIGYLAHNTYIQGNPHGVNEVCKIEGSGAPSMSCKDDSIYTDRDTGIIYQRVGTDWGVLQQNGSDESALTTYTLDCRLNNKFKKTIGAATTFTFNVDGYAEGQFIKFNIWAEPNAGVGVAPSYALTSGTLTPKSKASNYNNTLFTNIEVGLYITASGAEYVIYETSA